MGSSKQSNYVTQILATLLYYKVLKSLVQAVEEFYVSVPYVLDLASSSSGRYHQAHDGTIHSIGDHTLEVLGGVAAMQRSITKEFSDRIWLMSMIAAAVHDGLKRGWELKNHTVDDHDRLAAQHFLKVLHQSPGEGWFVDKREVQALLCMIAYHNGPWTGTINIPEFSLYPYNLVHICDMQSAYACLRNPYKEIEDIRKLEKDFYE